MDKIIIFTESDLLILIASRDPTSPSANQAYSQPAKQKPAISVTGKILEKSKKALGNSLKILPKSSKIWSKMEEIGARGYPKEATRSEDDKKSL